MSSVDTIVVKLVEGTVIDFAELQNIVPAAVVEPLAPDVDPDDLRGLTAEARDADPGAEIALRTACKTAWCRGRCSSIWMTPTRVCD